MITRRARSNPIGGMPPMLKPVRSYASRAVARRISGSAVTAASRAMSTRLRPETRHTIGSWVPSSCGATKTSDLTIWPRSAPTAAAASWAVCVDSSKATTSSVTPLRPAASRTRRTAGWSVGWGTAGVYIGSGRGAVSIWTMQVIVLADGQVGPRAALDAAWPGWLEAGARVVAADGGARHAGPLGLEIDRWVGDGDSLGAAGIRALEAAGVPIELARPDKDESDTELAVLAARAMGATQLTVLGALGGPRVDHALANLGLLSMPELEPLGVRLVAVDARVRRLLAPAADGGPARLDLAGRVGDLVSLLPIGADAEGVTTHGLAYRLQDEPLLAGRTRGLSNIRDLAEAAVVLRRGQLLVIETPATL